MQSPNNEILGLLAKMKKDGLFSSTYSRNCTIIASVGYQLFVYLHSADTPKFIRICIDFSWQFDQWPGEMVDFADYVIGYRGMLVRLVDDPCEQYSFIEIMDVEGGAQ